MANTKSGAKRVRAAERQRQAKRKTLLTRLGIGAGVVVMAAFFILAFTEGDTAVGATETENWDLPALDGDGRVVLSDFEGKPTVVAFFSSWCHVCQRELPGFAELSDLVAADVNFVGINTMNNGSGLPFARQMGISRWPLARDIGQHDGRQLATNFGARGSPTTVLYDESGVVVDVTLGGMNANQLAQKLNQFFGVTGS